MDREELDELVRLLLEDEPRNAGIVNFLRRNEILDVQRCGRSVRVRGRSDYVWNLFSSEDARELGELAGRLGDDDDRFATVEDWMVPILTRGRKPAWTLPMVRLVLGWDVPLPKRDGDVGELATGDAEHIYEHSKYREFISVDYTRSCIVDGPTVAIRDGGLLVAWAMTQDDGAMGFLQVLEEYQRRGYARRITVALAAELRSRGQLPFAYVAEDNHKSMALLASLGFVRDRKVRWFQLE